MEITIGTQPIDFKILYWLMINIRSNYSSGKKNQGIIMEYVGQEKLQIKCEG